MTDSKEPQKKKSNPKRKTLPIEEFFRQAKKEEKAVIIRPHEVLKTNAGNYCKITPRHLEIVKEMSELGCTDKDIRDKIGLKSSVFGKYMMQGRIIEEYLMCIGCEPSEDEWENMLPAVIDLEDEDGKKARIYESHIKYKFYRALVDGRIDANIDDLRAIRNAGDKDWKAKAYVLENRSPEYRKNSDEQKDRPKTVVQNYNLFQSIERTAKQIEEEDKKRGMLSNNSRAEKDYIDVENYTKEGGESNG